MSQGVIAVRLEPVDLAWLKSLVVPGLTNQSQALRDIVRAARKAAERKARITTKKESSHDPHL